MGPNFEPIRIDRQDEYRELLKVTPQCTSDYAFANLWGWAEHYGLEWAFVDGLCWIRQTKPETVYWAPVGDWNAHDWSGCSCLEKTGNFIRVPEMLAKIWAEKCPTMELTERRDHWDYVYSVQELIELRGNRFHKKKNLLKQFQKKYESAYSPMGPECVEEVLDMQAEWLGWYEDDASEALKAENVAITRVLHDFDRIKGLRGGAIRIDGKVVAYSIAECLDKDTLVIHFEKGNIRYKGIYQAINQMFLEDIGTAKTFVNREQDLGEEGLRKAKLSYNPVKFMEKYDARCT